MSRIRRRTLTSGLVVLAASLPAAAQARVVENPANGAGVPSAPANAAPSSAALSQAERQVQSVRPAPVAPSATTADPGFDWGDAAVGSAATIVVLGAATAFVGAGRRRRADRPLAG